MAQLNQFPDLCLLAIFARVSLIDLLTIGLVSNRWKALLPQVANKITSLTISIGFDPFHGISTRFIQPYTDLLKNENPSNNDLKYHKKKYTYMNSLIFKGNFNFSLAKRITNIFSNVTSLEVTFSQMSNESVESVVHLLNHYHSQLISIKLFCAHNELMTHGNPYFDCSPLLSSINRLPSPLRCLLIQLTDKTTIKTTTLPIITQLEQFYYYNSNYNGDKYKSIVNYIMQNPNLRQFGVDNISLGPIIMHKMHNKVTKIINSGYPTIYSEIFCLFFMCDKFPSLTTVAAKACTNLFHTIFGPLLKLQNLAYLQLRVTFGDPKYTFCLEQFRMSARRPDILEQLASIKILELELKYMKIASDFIDLDISYRFPSVQVIKLVFSGEQPNDDEKRKVHSNLRMCAQLHHLFDDSVAIWYRADGCLKDCANMYNHGLVED